MRFGRIADATIRTVIGVDFSGAAQSGKTAWIAELSAPEPLRLAAPASARLASRSPRFRLVSLQPLGRPAGGDDRDRVNRYLVDRIASQSETFWGCDFPFGLPIELALGDWQGQLSYVSEFVGSAKEFGLSLVETTERVLGTKHVRRTTDRETQTPFDCYHYRIIYQTYHGMREVLAELADHPNVLVLPFQYPTAGRGTASSILVEACPSSTLKRLGLPHQRYKQSGGKPPEAVHRRTRRTILKTVSNYVDISSHRRRVIMQDPGGDALDAVLAGLGAWLGFSRADHAAIESHPRYAREGFVYC
ncbi:DUF429 domain-containing protein [Stieleria sp. ICT_E10.1]|uniref:DUF429 domain-containing protein n=1 Tax=Stieleria sedimenti TaxID=2976331 RepID=UPI00217FB0CD|nr:DUF429 domain-containing protein [Stieleria sedimenti]MCS7467055.1 DUF429 domain-containing protein [Stieleria sedimenti]